MSKEDLRLDGAYPRGHYVYFLFQGAQLLYIGRAYDPEKRRQVFRRRTGVEVELGDCLRFSTLEEAQDAERAAIREHLPPYNQKVTSTQGMSGQRHSEETRKKIGAKHRGKHQSEEAKARLRAAAKGRPSPFKGRHWSEADKQRLRELALAREAKKRGARNE